MSKTSLRELSQNTMLYTLCSLLQRAVGFLLLPVYTRYLTPADYGVMQLLDITVDIAAILFVSGMTAGLQRYYFMAKSDHERNQVVSTTFFLEMGLGAAAAIALFFAAPLASYIGLREAQHVMFVRIAATNFLLSILLSVPMLLIQTQKRAGLYLLVSMGRLALQVTLNLTFLVGFGLGVAGILYAGFFVNLIVGTALVTWLIRNTGLSFNVPLFRQLRAFGVPYQISTAGAFILAFGDRFFLGHSRSISEVGLYGLAYQFGFLLSSLVESPFHRAWTPVRFQQSELPRSERDLLYSQGLDLLSIAVVLVGSGVVLFTPFILRLLTTPEFHPAAAMVPIVIAAYVVQCYTMVVAFGIDVSTRTKYYTYATWASAASIIVLYALLIPRFGGFGAAWATFLAFLIRFALTYSFAQQLWPVNYQWDRVLRTTSIGLLTALAAWALPSPTGLWMMLVKSTVLYCFCALAIWVTVLRPEQRLTVIGMLRKSFRQLPIFRRHPAS